MTGSKIEKRLIWQNMFCTNFTTVLSPPFIILHHPSCLLLSISSDFSSSIFVKFASLGKNSWAPTWPRFYRNHQSFWTIRQVSYPGSAKISIWREDIFQISELWGILSEKKSWLFSHTFPSWVRSLSFKKGYIPFSIYIHIHKWWKITRETPEVCFDKRKPSWTLFEH